MAVQPKKNKSKAKAKTITKKKPTPKKSTTKPKKRRSKKKTHTKKNIFIILALFMMFTFVGLGFYLGKNSDDIASAIQRGEIEGDYTTKQLLEDLSKMQKQKKKKKEIIIVKEKPKSKPVSKLKVIKSKPTVSAVKKTVAKKTVAKNPTSVHNTKKPKLAIIIDDISKASQLAAMKTTHVKMTPSIFPPSELSMTSHRLAKGLKHYMIHLPMESGSKQFNTQYKTLLTSFSTKQIASRVHELRQLFPNAHYINNHTGSVYTNNYKAMRELYKDLRKEGFMFVDSRTVGSSKVRKVVHEFGDKYISRDVFIDNIHTIPYIHGQLKKAVKIAKKKGYAIAIGHPHKITMQALKSANEILKDVELVYIDRMY